MSINFRNWRFIAAIKPFTSVIPLILGEKAIRRQYVGDSEIIKRGGIS